MAVNLFVILAISQVFLKSYETLKGLLVGGDEGKRGGQRRPPLEISYLSRQVFAYLRRL